MTGKRLLILAVAVLILEIVILVIFGGFGSEAEKKDDVLGTIGPIKLYKHDMGLIDFQNVPQWNLDGTPEGEPTFWGLNKTTTKMLLLIDLLIIISAFFATRNMKMVPSRLQNFYEVVVELFSKGNIILCDEDMNIISPLEIQKWKARTIRPKEDYKFPEARVDPFKLSEKEFSDIIGKSDKENISKNVRK